MSIPGESLPRSGCLWSQGQLAGRRTTGISCSAGGMWNVEQRNTDDTDRLGRKTLKSKLQEPAVISVQRQK